MSKKSTRAQRIKTKSSQRRETKKLELKQEILSAATELFLEHGYEKFSLRQVAEAIGYSPTSIYLHFKNKEELLFMTALEGFRRFGEMLEQGYKATNDPYGRIFSIGRAYVDFALEYPVHYRLMFMQDSDLIYKKLPDCDESIIDSFEILQKTLVEAMEAKVIKEQDILVLSKLIWAHVHGIASLAISLPELTKDVAYDMLELNEVILKSGLKGA
ncbi:MAG TPA: TetR/AcrR family transcriptional regulator [Trueperaceae bacterium]|nr:TetR/AcrR family transcriptional regulator [Trueperaceae bacterium]